MWRDLNDGDKQEFINEYENAKVDAISHFVCLFNSYLFLIRRNIVNNSKIIIILPNINISCLMYPRKKVFSFSLHSLLSINQFVGF